MGGDFHRPCRGEDIPGVSSLHGEVPVSLDSPDSRTPVNNHMRHLSHLPICLTRRRGYPPLTDEPKRRRTWTALKDEVLRRMYTEGVPADRIAAELDTTPAYVRVRAFRLGVKRGPRSQPLGIPRPPERDDIATRLRILLGETVRPPSERRVFADEELLAFAGLGPDPMALEALAARARPWILERIGSGSDLNSTADDDGGAWARVLGLDLFSRGVLLLELMDHQLAMAYTCLASKRAVCLAGRQSGKDVTQAALALWEAVTVPNARIVLVSGAQRQSDLLMEKTLSLVARDVKLFDSVRRSSREVLELTNGSFVKALPATGLIRGETASRVFLNEARDVLNEEETYSAVEPMLLTTGGSLAIFTTPLGKTGRVWEAFNSPLYLRTQIPSTASRYTAPEHLERQRLEMSAPLFACEYEAAFRDVQSSYFSAESIARCARNYDAAMVREEGFTYALGIDWARTRDTSAMVVMSRDAEDFLRLAYLRGFVGVPMPDQVAFVQHLHATFAFHRIVSEYAGLGIGPTDQLVKELGHVVESFRPTAETKALGYDHLKLRLETGTIEIPMDPKLLAELRTLEFKVSPAGNVAIHHPGGGSDDFADATMLASWPFRRRPPSSLRVSIRYRPFMTDLLRRPT